MLGTDKQHLPGSDEFSFILKPFASSFPRFLEHRGPPAFPAGPCQPDSRPMSWRRPEPGEIGPFASVHRHFLGPICTFIFSMLAAHEG